jgi:hypothetical protein
LLGTDRITSKGSIMLQSIAGTVLVDREARGIRRGIGKGESIAKLTAGSQTLPRILSLQPPTLAMEALVGRVQNILKVIHCELFTL